MYDIVTLYEGDKGEMFLRDLKNVRIDKPPGKSILYSNAGMILLGNILEKVYNKTYAELLDIYFISPFNLEHTGIVYFQSGTENYTRGYDKEGNIMPHITFQIAGAAGGIKSCTADLIKYIRANLISGNEAMRLSQKPTISYKGQEVGLGWQIYSDYGAKILWHDGGEPGFSSYITIIPDYDIGIICLTNQRGRQSQLEDLSQSILKTIIKY
jgi:CubicO group peptidase (beta-lactamase class C family)